MAGRKVSREQAREHERRAWELRQQGWTQARIAKEIGVDQSSVTTMLQRIDARVLADLGEQVTAKKIAQDETLSYLLDEAIQAWKKDNDPQHMEAARKILADLRKVWGLDAVVTPKKPTDDDDADRTATTVSINVLVTDKQYVEAIERLQARVVMVAAGAGEPPAQGPIEADGPLLDRSGAGDAPGRADA